MQAVLEWTRATHNATVRFVVSPVPVAASAMRGDGWGECSVLEEGLRSPLRFAALFQHERAVLLNLMSAPGAPKTIFLSGDGEGARAFCAASP